MAGPPRARAEKGASPHGGSGPRPPPPRAASVPLAGGGPELRPEAEASRGLHRPEAAPQGAALGTAAGGGADAGQPP